MRRFGVVVGLGALAGLAYAALVHRDAICARTALTVVGTVLRAEPGIVTLGPIRRAQTRVKLFVEGVAHGQAPPRLNVAVWAGEINGLRKGQPRMRVGERYLLLLEETERGLAILQAGQGAVLLDPEARLPGASALETVWEMACRAPLDVEQRPFGEAI